MEKHCCTSFKVAFNLTFYYATYVPAAAAAAAAAAKSLQSCPTLCDPIDGSLPSNEQYLVQIF